jgi:hypothetical protein
MTVGVWARTHGDCAPSSEHIGPAPLRKQTSSLGSTTICHSADFNLFEWEICESHRWSCLPRS